MSLFNFALIKYKHAHFCLFWKTNYEKNGKKRIKDNQKINLIK